MRFVIQRVQNASVTVDDKVTGSIDKGFLVLIGVCEEDNEEIAEKMIHKLLGLRIFADSKGKTNLALKDVGGKLLLVSQFTLYADMKRGFRPSFIRAAKAEQANNLYEYICSRCAAEGYEVQKGIFGADMKVSLLNDGPFTIILDSAEL